MTGKSGPKRLHRSRRDRVFGGVCGGIAEYFNIDPVVVRLLWVFSFFAYGFGLLFYLISLFAIPSNPDQVPSAKNATGRLKDWISAIGTALGNIPKRIRSWSHKNRFFKSRDERFLFGVCGGLAHRFEVDPVIVRLISVGAFFFSAGFVFFLYVVAAAIMPYEEEEVVAASENGSL